jgi:putative hydrolase of the HAD superfamily
MKYRYIFFDVGGTLLEKDQLYPAFLQVLAKYGYDISLERFRSVHMKLTNETIFSSRPTENEYEVSNRIILQKLGIDATPQIVKDFYTASKSLNWSAIPDTVHLTEMKLPLGIISNWSSNLENRIASLMPYHFAPIIGSETAGIAKPDVDIFGMAIQKAGITANQAIYIGNSLKLDMEPAGKAGLRPILIDRYQLYPEYAGEKINSLSELKALI